MKYLVLPLLLLACTANATWVSIDPDDYAVGVPITSPYVDLISLGYGGGEGVYRTNGPVHPVLANGNAVFTFDPTGTNSGGYTANFDPNTGQLVYGLLFDFAQPVYEFQIDTISKYGTGGFSLFVDCYAFDPTGARTPCKGNENFLVPYGETKLLSMVFPDGLGKLYLGGGDSIQDIYFDRASFNTVPEPGTLALFSIGLLALVALRRATPMMPRSSGCTR